MTRTIGPYEVIGPLGRGGMGRVLEVRDPALPGRRLALKLLDPMASPETIRRFELEAELLARVKHPCVVEVHTAGHGPEGPFLVMDLVEGASLEENRRSGPLAPRRAAELIADLAGALAALHERGVIHRDLKPDNVMLKADGRPVLIDFGIARSMDGARLTRTGALLGTPSYLAPEQARGSQVDERVDVWGLGALLFTLLAGRPPFEAPSLPELLVRIRLAEPRWPSQDAPSTPPELEAILRRCLAKEPDQRWPTAAALEQALRAWLDGAPGAGQPARGTIAPLLLVLLAVVGAALAAALLANRRREEPAPPTEAPVASALETRAPSPVLALPHGPARAIGVRFLAADRALTWSTLPPWERGSDSTAAAGPSQLQVWGLDPVRSLATVPLEGLVEQVAPLPRGELLLVVRGSDRAWRLARFDPLSGAPPSPLGVEGAGPWRVTALATTPDGKLAALAEHRHAPDGTPEETQVYVVDLAGGRQLARISAGDTTIHALLFHPDGILYTAGELSGGRLSSWKRESWLRAAPGEVVTGTSQTKLVRKLSAVPRALILRGADLLAGDEAGHVRLFDVEDRPVGTRLGGPVSALFCAADGTFVALASGDDPRLAEVSAFGLETRLGSLRGWERPLTALDLSPDGARVAVGFAGGDRAELFPAALLRAGGVIRRDALGATR